MFFSSKMSFECFFSALYFFARTFYFSIHFKSVAITYWKIFIMAALKSLIDYFRSSVILESASVDCFFFPQLS